MTIGSAQLGRATKLAARTLALSLLAFPAVEAQNQILDQRILAPFVPTPQLVVEKMLELAAVGEDDIVYDLGSGDGRILITAARDFKARAVGIEINRTLVEQTLAEVEKLDLADRVDVVQAHLLEADLSKATVVTVYLLGSSMKQLKPKLEAELAPGSRVVSHDYQFEGWQPEDMAEVGGGRGGHRIYLYRIAENSDQ